MNYTMKKILYAIPLLALIFASCDPKEIDLGSPDSAISENALAEGFSFSQWSDESHATPQADGNYFTFTTNPVQPVIVYQLVDGKINVIGSGSSGHFKIIPKRGQASEQVFYVKSANHESATTVQENVNVYVPSDLTPEMKLLASNSYGKKVWTWDTEFRADQGAWGNMGYATGSGDTFADAGNGIWFACFPDYLENPNPNDNNKTQMEHSDTGTPLGEGVGAYMEFNDDGTIVTYSQDGKVIRQGKYSVDGYTGERNHASIDGSQANWSYGTLKTDAGTILWPFEINWKKNKRPACPTEFEIMQLDINHLKLIYAKPGTGGWGEATWWAFKSESDAEGALTNYDTKSWTWDTEFRADQGAWGNMGYAVGSGDTFADAGNGIWFACFPDYLENPNPNDNNKTQMEHSNLDKPLGEGVGAYMTFDLKKGLVTTYNPSGNQIRQGKFEIKNWANGKRHIASIDGSQASWALGTLHTDEGSILWPFEINWRKNKRPACPTDFEIMQLNGNSMKLVYAKPGTGGWGEATWWAFKAKK